MNICDDDDDDDGVSVKKRRTRVVIGVRWKRGLLWFLFAFGLVSLALSA